MLDERKKEIRNSADVPFSLARNSVKTIKAMCFSCRSDEKILEVPNNLIGLSLETYDRLGVLLEDDLRRFLRGIKNQCRLCGCVTYKTIPFDGVIIDIDGLKEIKNLLVEHSPDKKKKEYH